jgi:O-antigen/teichoic acid export membrane protein
MAIDLVEQPPLREPAPRTPPRHSTRAAGPARVTPREPEASKPGSTEPGFGDLGSASRDRQPLAALSTDPAHLPRWIARGLALARHPGVWSIADQALVSGTSFVTGIAIARCCSRAELGLFALAVSLVALARAIQEQLVTAPFMVFAGRRSGVRLASYTGSCLAHQLQLTAVFVGLFGLAWFAARWTGSWSELQTLFPALLLALPCLLCREHVRQTSFGLLRPGAAIAVDLVATTTQLGLMLLLWHRDQLTIPYLFLAMGAGCAIATAGWLLAFSTQWTMQTKRVRYDFLRNWRLGRWALACHLVGQLSPYLMPWVLAGAHDISAAGLLAACTTLVGPASLLVTGYANHLTPKAARAFSQGGAAALRPIILGTMQLFSVLLGLFCLVAWITGDSLIELVYGASFAEDGAGTLLTLLAVVVLVNSLGTIAGNALWAMERASANFRADVATLVVTLVCAAGLVPTWGALGCVTASLAGAVAGAGLRSWILFDLFSHAAAPVAFPISTPRPEPLQ